MELVILTQALSLQSLSDLTMKSSHIVLRSLEGQLESDHLTSNNVESFENISNQYRLPDDDHHVPAYECTVNLADSQVISPNHMIEANVLEKPSNYTSHYDSNQFQKEVKVKVIADEC